MKKQIIISVLAASIMVGASSGAVYAEDNSALTDETITETMQTDTEKEEEPVEEETVAVTEAEEKETEAVTEAEEEETEAVTEAEEEETEAATEAVEEETETVEKDEAEDKPKKETPENREERLENKATKLTAVERLRDLKALAKEAKIESLDYLKEMRGMFTNVDKSERKSLLEEIAAVKTALKDYSIDTFVNGLHLDFEKYDNVLPVIENGRTLVPVRAITEALGSEVEWNNETKEITITKGDVVITMTIGDNTAYVNTEAQELDTAPEIRSGRTLVPARFIAEAFGLTVEWDQSSLSVIIE